MVLGTWWQHARDGAYFFTDEVKKGTRFITVRFSLIMNIINIINPIGTRRAGH